MRETKRPTPDKRVRSEVARAQREKRRVAVLLGGVPNLHARVSSTGAVSYSLRYRVDGVLRRVTFRADDIGAARSHARDLLAKARRARVGAEPDPWIAARDARAEAARRRLGGETVADLAKRYFIDAERRLAPATVTAYRNILDARVLPALGKSRPDHVERSHVRSLVDGIRREGRDVHANRVLATLKALFTWALERDAIQVHPCAGIKATKETPRDRVYSDDELLAILAGAATTTELRLLVPLLLLTATRSGEARSARWEDVDLGRGVWSVRATDIKGGNRVIPLSPLALEVVEALPRGVFLFPADTREGFADPPQAEVDKIRSVSGVEDFRLHTLRTTARTRLSELGVPPDVGERILGHSMGKVRAIYDRFDFLPQMRNALDLWGAEVARIAKGKKTGAGA